MYNGVTIIASNPSRFDAQAGHLLSGFAGDYFAKAITPINFKDCHLRIVSAERPWRDGTKLVILLGQEALSYYQPGAILNQQRGCPWVEDGKLFISTYSPQEAIDQGVKWEAAFNDSFGDSEIDDIPDTDEKSTKGKTSPAHWRFWLYQDCRKIARLYVNPSLSPRVKTEFVLCPDIGEVTQLLTTIHDQPFYLDIETDEHFYISCLSFTWGSHPFVYVVPLFNFSGNLFHSEIETGKFLVSLSSAICGNISVCHNSMFDLFVLANVYRIPIGRRIYDTMLAHARLYPDTEKSLGHCGSLYTNEPYHKSEGIFNPRNAQEQEQLWRYNAKDSYVMREIHLEQLARANKIRGALDSINQVNASIYPYLCMSMYGARIDHEKMLKQLEINERWLAQFDRVLKTLVGKPFNPRSNKQMPWYFHEYCKYKMVAKTKAGKPALGEENLYKLALLHDNPVIPVCIAYRGIGKQNGVLKLRPWYGSLWKIDNSVEEEIEEEVTDDND